MNDLNAQQIVLLTLLVSFVTSIATGITTVSLLEKAPEPVTQTINKVVERTIERVIPQENENNQVGVTVERTPEKEIVTVVVNEEDLTIEAIEKNSMSLARIYLDDRNGRTFSTLGVVFDDQGRLITDASKIQSGEDYVGVYQSGTFELEVVYREPNDPYAILKIKDGQENNGFKPAEFGNSQILKLGQSVISLSGRDDNTVSTGIISSLETEDGVLNEEEVTSDISPEKTIKLIEATINQNNVLAGSIILNLQGKIIGIRVSNDTSKLNTFVPSNGIQEFLTGK